MIVIICILVSLVILLSGMYLVITHPFWWKQPVVHTWDIYRRFIFPFTCSEIKPMYRNPRFFPIPMKGIETRRITTRPIGVFCEMLLTRDWNEESHLPNVLHFIQRFFLQSDDSLFMGNENYIVHMLNADRGYATICTDAMNISKPLGVIGKLFFLLVILIYIFTF